MKKINLRKPAGRFIQKLDAKQYKQVVSKIFEWAKNPFPSDSKQLKGYEGYYRADIGEYRIIYKVNDDTLEIPIVSKRNDGQVYKELKNLNN